MAFPAMSAATTVRLKTTLGIVDIQLFDTTAPLTVANFLTYVNGGAYNNSFIHRSMPGFVIQAGGYTWDSATNTATQIKANPPVVNEFSASRSNLRGTIAMAKVAGDPNSATSEWFINLANNAANLDNQNGGFTVFGQVLGNGMEIIDAIAALPTVNAGGVFANLPLVSPKTAASYQRSNLVMLDTVLVDPEMQAPTVPTGLIATAASATAINLSWTAAADNVGVTYHKIYSGGNYLASTTTNAPKLLINGAAPRTTYAIAVAACDAAGNCSAPSASVSVTTLATGPTLSLVAGWNLMGNSLSAPLAVATAFADPAKVSTVWKWIAATGKWAFYAPAQADGGSAYAASRSYDSLTAINGGEGFWVNAKQAFTVQLPDGEGVTSASLRSLPSGWSLVAVEDGPTPSEFNRALSAAAPASGTIPANVNTLWAWDNPSGKWYFYAPSLEANGEMSSYNRGKNYLDFGSLTLTPATGFWVNRP